MFWGFFAILVLIHAIPLGLFSAHPRNTPVFTAEGRGKRMVHGWDAGEHDCYVGGKRGSASSS